MDKELLEKKKRLQKTKNILKELAGLEIISIEEISLSELVDMDMRRNKMIPDSKIGFSDDISAIVNWIENNVPFKEDSDFYFIVNTHCVKARIANSEEAYSSIWAKMGRAIFLSDSKKTMYEFGCDSRDEYNYLFDKCDLE